MRKKLNIKSITIISMFSAISALLYMFLKFPVPFFPSFLEFNFSMIPILIILFLYGPFQASFVILIRFLVKIALSGGSSTAYVGEIADIIIAMVTILSVYITYKILTKKSSSTKKPIIISLAVGMISWCFIAVISNWLILIPMYVQLYYGGSIEPLVALCSMIPGINADNFMIYYLFIACLPFNLVLSFLVSIVTYFVFIRVKKPLSQMYNKEKKSYVDNENINVINQSDL
ncbi:MAG: ECF transporter S component [Anaeroplasmataceae bacterium]